MYLWIYLKVFLLIGEVHPHESDILSKYFPVLNSFLKFFQGDLWNVECYLSVHFFIVVRCIEVQLSYIETGYVALQDVLRAENSEKPTLKENSEHG